MRIIYQKSLEDSTYRTDVWELLCQCDDEFLPRLSARESSAQQDLGKASSGTEPFGEGTGPLAEGTGPVSYFREMKKQGFLLVVEGERLLAFMSFRQQYICKALENFGQSLYVTTVCVHKDQRGRGILGMLYSWLEDHAKERFGTDRISTRTWSGNHRHIRHLENRGYHSIEVLNDDRGPGIDTVYFGIELS